MIQNNKEKGGERGTKGGQKGEKGGKEDEVAVPVPRGVVAMVAGVVLHGDKPAARDRGHRRRLADLDRREGDRGVVCDRLFPCRILLMRHG